MRPYMNAEVYCPECRHNVNLHEEGSWLATGCAVDRCGCRRSVCEARNLAMAQAGAAG